MSKLKISKAFLYRKKGLAKRQQTRLHKSGYRAIVAPASKVTQQRSPSLK